jgi:DNA-binding NtrC family response regulator
VQKASGACEDVDQAGRKNSTGFVTGGNLIQDIASLMMHAGRPELLARDLIAVLAGSGSVAHAAAVTRSESGTTDLLATFGAPSPPSPSTRQFRLGTARGRQVEVTVDPLPDLESLATLHAVSMLLDTIRDLELAQAEREQQLTLWPVDELPVDDDEAIITGRMRDIMNVARRVARTNASVLITGESGTGKEILARAIHAHSTRADKPFVPFNCTAVPRDMLESQLFGHRRGAFTGADRDYAGLIRTARDGTLFLDEIGEMSLDLQPKLLRFLESGEISPLGEPGPLTVNVRVVAATNANLDDLVRAGRFREDLFYRLNVIGLPIPPLRERRDEIPALVHHFVARAAAEFGKARIRLAEETMDHLLLYDWPGNVRQLQNEIRRMVALVENDATLTPAALSPAVRRAASKAMARNAPGALTFAVAPGEKLSPAISRIEREMIRAALRASHGRVDAAARALGISRKGLYLKRQRLGL